MLISWDERKNDSNFKKHGVRFEEAATVLFNPMTLSSLNKHSDQDRFEYLGHSDRSNLYMLSQLKKTNTKFE